MRWTSTNTDRRVDSVQGHHRDDGYSDPSRSSLEYQLFDRCGFSSNTPTPRLPRFEQLNLVNLLTAAKGYLCPACGKEARDKFDFKKHYMIHSGEKPFACPYCSHATSRKDYLVAHVKSKH